MFTPSGVITGQQANEIVYPVEFVAQIQTDGTISVVLPATNDPDLVPAFQYSVTESIINSSASSRKYNITLPYNAVGGTIDISDISPSAAPLPQFGAVPASQNSGYPVFNVEDYGGGPGKSSQENSDAVVATLEASGSAGYSTGGIILFPKTEQYNLVDRIGMWGYRGQILTGVGERTKLKWVADFPSNPWPDEHPSCIYVNPDYRGRPGYRIERFSAEGPGVLGALGVSPCVMSGPEVSPGVQAYELTTSLFHGGYVHYGDHNGFEKCMAFDNFYGVHWRWHPTRGDVSVNNCDFCNNRKASIGIEGNNNIEGTHFSNDTHFGWSPFGIICEGPGGDFIYQVTMTGVFWEYCGNELISDGGTGRTIQGLYIYGAHTNGSGVESYHYAGAPRRAPIAAGGITTLVIDSEFAFRPERNENGASVYSGAIATDSLRSLDWRNAGYAIDDCVDQGIPFIKPINGLDDNIGTWGNRVSWGAAKGAGADTVGGRGRVTKLRTGATAVSQGHVLETGSRGTVRKWQGDTLGGIAATPASAGDGVICVDEGHQTIRVGGAVGDGSWLKPNPANDGTAVQVASTETNQMIFAQAVLGGVAADPKYGDSVVALIRFGLGKTSLAATPSSVSAVGSAIKQMADPSGNVNTDSANLRDLLIEIEGMSWWPIIQMQPGQYWLNLEQNYPGFSIIQGAGDMETEIRWQTAPGTAKYIFKPLGGPGNAPNQVFRDLAFVGPAPGGGFVRGTAPNLVRGIMCDGSAVLQNVRFASLWAGQTLVNDHIMATNIRGGNNFYHIYFEPDMYTGGDNSWKDCILSGALMAGVGAAPHQSAGFSPLAGDLFLRCHFGYGPYAFHRETGSPNVNWMTNVRILQCAFEFLGRGGFMDENWNNASGLSNIVGLEMDLHGLTWDTAGKGIVGRAITGLFKVGALKYSHLTFPIANTDGNFGGISDALFDVDPAHGHVSQENHIVNPPFGTGATAGQKFFTDNSDIRLSTFERRGNYRGRFLLSTSALTANYLTRRSGRDNCLPWASTFAPAGFAATAAAVNGIVPVVTSGYTQAVASAKVDPGKYIKADDANPGKVIQATGPTDGVVVGISLTGVNNPGGTIQINAMIPDY